MRRHFLRIWMSFASDEISRFETDSSFYPMIYVHTNKAIKEKNLISLDLAARKKSMIDYFELITH